MQGTQRSDGCCFVFTSLLVEWREGALRPSVPDQVGPCSGHTFTGGSPVTHAQLKCWAASELLLQCLSPCASTSYSLAPKRRGLWGALSRETEGAGNCAAQADGVTRRELERESTHWLGHVPLPQPPAQGQGLDPCLLNQEAWQEVETGLEEG